MKNWRLPAALVVLIALALGAAWLLSRPDQTSTNKAADLEDTRAKADGGDPLKMKPRVTGIEPATTDKSSQPEPAINETAPAPAPTPEVVAPNVDTPDYGPSIQRGGAFVDFELYDPAGTRVPVHYYSVKLWRKIGSYWVREEVIVDSSTHVIRCVGLGEQDIPPTGLEPGEYQLELQSNSWGNFRHDFAVTRGETRTEKLTTPNTRIAVSLCFKQMDGTPISHLPDVPSVKAVSTPLDAVSRDPAPKVELRRAPTEGGGSGGGMHWRSSSSGPSRDREWPEPPLYATDNGVMWTIVFAGAENTVTVKLNSELYGVGEYAVVDTFTSRTHLDVTLICCADFETRLLEWGKPIPGFKAGYAEILDKPLLQPQAPPFDPYTALVREYNTRLIIELESPVPMTVQVTRDVKMVETTCYKQYNVHFYDVYTAADWWFRLTDGRFYVGPWEKLDLAAGQVLTLQRSVNESAITIDLRKLSPTLREFAHTADFDIALRVDDPIEDPKIIEDAKETPEGNEPAVQQHPADPRNDVPALHERIAKFVMHRQAGSMQFKTIAAGESVDRAIGQGLSLRTHLRGAARWNRERNSSASRGADGLFYWDAKVLNGNWQSFDTAGQNLQGLLNAGMLQPEFKNVFIARAVGPNTEGLPWVRGLIMRHEDDAVAQEVRDITRRWPEYIDIQAPDPTAYAKALGEAKDDAAFRALIGERAFDAFETAGQRQWFARHGAWYDTGRKVYADEQGYIAIENPGLEPGGYYVLYLWSNSKDEFTPDARFVFQVDENGVADLGAIHMPTYTD